MIRMDLQRFGGRGGDSTSAAWMGSFFKAANKGAANQDDKDEIKAARKIYNAMKKEKRDGVAWAGAIDAENRVLNGFRSSAAKYDRETGDLTVERGKLTQARRDFETYIKNKYWQHYEKGRTRAKYGSYLKRFKLKK